MTHAEAAVRPRAWAAFVLAAVLVLAPGAVAWGDPVTPTDEASPATPEPRAACETSARREAQAVVCDLEGMAAETAVALTVLPADDSTADAAIGGSTTALDGTARVDTEVPCGVDGLATVEVSGATADGGRFRHVEPVTLDGSCRAVWELTSDEWATVVATLLVLGVAAVFVVAWRRRVRRRRRRRGVSSSRRRRSRPPARQERGRRRSPRRTTRRR